MRCSPTQRNSYIWIIVGALLLFGGISNAIPILYPAVFAPAIFQLLTVLAIVAAVFFVVRYQMTGFVYLIHPRSHTPDSDLETAFAGHTDDASVTRLPPEMLDFVVVKSQGSRAGATECVLSLSDLVAVYPLTKSGETKKSIRERYITDGYVCYDYTLTLGLDNALALVFIDGNRYAGIFIEPDEAMRAYFMGLGKTGRGKKGDF